MAARLLTWTRCAAAFTLLLAGAGCRGRDTDTPGGKKTQMQADATVRQAIRQSPEGFIFFPSKRAEAVYELPRLNEIAQSMRQPAAACFLERAVETMKPAPAIDDGYDGVPDGQAKLRLRIGADGKVLRVETLETGFVDDEVPDCVSRHLKRRRFPQNETGAAHYIDVVYWVSLGAQPNSATHTESVKREQIEAGVRAKKCMQGRVGEGRYEVGGLNLVARNGVTVANRIEQVDVSQPVRQCLATAFRAVRLLPDDATFIRPVVLDVEFAVGPDGGVSVEGEEWLRLVKLEERARRAQARTELSDDELADDEGAVDPDAVDQLERPPAPEPEPEPEPEAPKVDPGQGGLRLDIGPRGGGGRAG